MCSCYTNYDINNQPIRYHALAFYIRRAKQKAEIDHPFPLPHHGIRWALNLQKEENVYVCSKRKSKGGFYKGGEAGQTSVVRQVLRSLPFQAKPDSTKKLTMLIQMDLNAMMINVD